MIFGGMQNVTTEHREDDSMRKLIVVIILALVFCATAEAKRKPTTQQKVKQTIYKYFHPLGQYRNALCIAGMESTGQRGHFNPRAFNGVDYGTFQIEWIAHQYFNKSRLFEIGYNVSAAKHIYLDAGGWSPWSTRGSCGV